MAAEIQNPQQPPSGAPTQPAVTTGVTPDPSPPSNPALDAEAARLQRESPAARAAREAAEQKARADRAEAELQRVRGNLSVAEQNAQAAAQNQFQAQLAQQAAQTNAQIAQMQQENFQLQLTMFRKDVIAQYNGQIIPGMVAVGPDGPAIQVSARNAHEEWKRIQAEAETRVRAQMAAQANLPPMPPPGPQAVPSTSPVPPMVPQGTYPQGYPGGYQAQPGGWPQVTNPVPPQVPQQVEHQQLQGLTSEEAVRRGVYAQNREAILAAVKNGGAQVIPFPSGPPQGAGPVNLPMMPQQALPGGAMAPQGTPMGPAFQYPGQGYAAPQMPQYTGPQVPAGPPVPQMQPPAPQYGVDPAAMAAIQRTHAGQNPVAGQNPGGLDAMRAAQQYAQQSGGNPVAVFQQRFAPTPPTGTGPNGQ